MAWRLRALVFTFLILLPAEGFADSVSFDLVGPTIDVRVTHLGKTLPISAVPNLEDGDSLWIRADFPPTQSVHCLLVAAFLRGATNPPPENWFHPLRTWRRKANDGFTIRVPHGARQVLLFLAPETWGDFKTLIGAVRGRPGSFVRASQDLNQATLDRSRLDTYLAAIRKLNQTDPNELSAASPLLARSLAIKLDPDCLDKIRELQAPCLMRGQYSLMLNDGHSPSVVDALNSGPSADLALQ